MKLGVGQRALAIAAFGLYATASATPAAADTASELRELKARLQQLEAQVAKQRAEVKHATNVANAANAVVAKGPPGPPPPPPVFVSFRNGLFVESADKQFSFKIGGRLFVDGGGTVGSPGNGWQGNVGFGQARLEVEGSFKPWFYKIQYDFANSTTQLWNTNLPNANGGTGLQFWSRNYVTDRNFLWGGFRDAYFGLQDPRLSHPLLAEPVYFKIGSQYESFSLEALASSKYRDTIERPLAVDAIAPFRHIGVAAGMIGKDNWTAHFGLYSLSFQDLNARPVNTSSGNAGVLVPAYSGYGVKNANWYQPWGGGAYWEATGRVTWAPILDEHRLVHLGVAGSYHQPNNATAYSDDRNSAPGNRLGSEANVLGTNFLGTTDLSCGRFAQSAPFVAGVANFNQYNAAGNCIKDIEKVDLEAALSYNNFFVQGEWLMANYNRNTSASQQFALTQLAQLGAASPSQGLFISPGNSNYVTTGGYVQGEWWITGEEKAQSYDLKDKNGVTFGQLKIKDPFTRGGWGAWGLVGRWSVLNLNNGPYQGASLYNNLAVANNAFGLFGPLPGTPAQIANATLLQNVISNSGVYGGYQQNVTAGVNWYPDNGIAFQFNATHVMSLKSPLNWNNQSSYESGSHPTFLEMRAKVYF